MYNRLDPDERTDIDNASRDKCVATYTPIYRTFREKSNEVFNSTSYDRAKGFYYEYKIGTDVKRKMDIRVWKRDGNADEIYFYITETQLSSESYFLRVTRVQNEEMIADLLTDHCVRTPSPVYTSTTSASGPLTVKYEYLRSNAPNTDEYIDSYSLPFSNLAMFANFRLTRKVTTKNSSGTIVGTASNYASTLTSKTYNFEGYNDASNSGRYTQKFCDFQYEIPADNHYRFSKDSTLTGFKWTCQTSLPVGWDLTL